LKREGGVSIFQLQKEGKRLSPNLAGKEGAGIDRKNVRSILRLLEKKKKSHPLFAKRTPENLFEIKRGAADAHRCQRKRELDSVIRTGGGTKGFFPNAGGRKKNGWLTERESY